MELYSQSFELSVLRGKAKATTLDINQCLSNVPMFLNSMKDDKSYIIDEAYVNSVKALIADAKDERKQWLGYLLIGKTFIAG